ncbi:hypothetical protein [[Clostridium] fimetarium]|uniref:Uncharacterized protein n=1 Tax=[Clostridium] fimetarium TaxID=99656 RepID=A0A1I0RD44_9FIRM|nr:hypothetical protein [[Clostridium] fimetarium]SEW38777.1 hypothetical protein SAMN05421659_11438 [[Clostridium] fimetarium]
MASNSVSFFYKLSQVEYGLQSEYDLDGKPIKYLQLRRDVFKSIKEFVTRCSWTNSVNTKFIVGNRDIRSSKALVEAYERKFPNSKAKSAATFRVQRASISKLLFNMFGENFDYIILFESQEKLLEMQTRVDIVKSSNRNHDFLIDGVGSKINLLSCSESEDLIGLDDCKNELDFLSSYSKDYFERATQSLDINKLKYLCSVLEMDSILYNDGEQIVNQQKIEILTAFHSATKSSVDSMVKVFSKDTKIQEIEPIFEDTEISEDELFDNAN